MDDPRSPGSNAHLHQLESSLMPVLPLDPTIGADLADVTPDALTNLHQHALCSSTGGFYPVGLFGTWHGGLHLTAHPDDDDPALGSPVRMPTGGSVVAIRLGDHTSPACTDLGSTNFVLTRHRWRDMPYFMLFQHLELTGASALIRGATAEARPLPSWLAAACGHRVTADMRLRAHPFGDTIATLKAGDRVLLRGGPLDPVEPSDAFGPDTRGALTDLNVLDSAHVREEDGYLWARVHVLSTRSTIEAGTVGAMAIRKSATGRTYIDGDGVLTASERQSLTEGDIVCLEAAVPAGDTLGWTGPFGPEPGSASLPPLSNTAKKLMRRHLGRDGQIASLQIPRANAVHWEIFSEDPVFGMEQRSADGSLREGIDPKSTDVVPIRWQRAQDLDDDLAIDSKRVLEALEEVQELEDERFPWLPSRASSWFENYDELSQTEVLRFYMDGYGARLQTCACRFHTAWGLPDAEGTATEAGWDVEATQALQWWDAVAGAIDGFPDTKHVWHYPPIEALRAVQWETERQQPTFHVEISGERHMVERFEDIRDLVFADMNVASPTIPELAETADPERLDEVRRVLHGMDVTVQVEDDEAFFASVLLRRHRYGWLDGWFAGVGTARSDTPDLYELLIDPADTEDMPDLSDFDANVWASISHSEGHLKAINTYDTAFVSVGPIQQTVGARNYRGELQGALDTAQSDDPDAYEEHLGRHGLVVVQPAMELGAKKAHFRLDDTVLDDADAKHPLRDFIWAYRLVETFEDLVMREPMLREGFSRLERIRGREITFNVEVSGTTHTIESTLGEIFRTDLAQALLLDTHVNYPMIVWSRNDEISIAIGAAHDVFKANGLTIPSIMSRNHDLKLIAALMQQRVDSRMASPAIRAIGILKYTDTDVVEDLAEAQDRDEKSVPTFLKETLDISEETAQEYWSQIQDWNRTVLTLSHA